MKRDMELVRKILLKAEETKQGEFPGILRINGYDETTTAYHVDRFKEAGLLEAAVAKSSDGSIQQPILFGLTWEGHEFLDAARDDRIWKKAMKMLTDKISGLPFSLVKDTLILLIKKEIS